MIVSGSAAVVLGLVIFVLVRYRVLSYLSLFLCGTFGFLLASTGLAPFLRSVLGFLANVLGSIG
ncbi:hypothetical protein [Phaeacidiphilus oryzae]|uniref:hypothetical protein n=1 Tax=Phaeacidiphilus oryzae TaxID=348818 RepID=UPI0005651116|nr:hypothetical protein [Phaeacidiphilus oryzae]